MYKYFLISVLSLFVSLPLCAELNEEELLSKAYELYESGRKDQAKVLFLEAANNGNAEANFYLGYAYVIDENERTFRYEQAALKGHEQALSGYLDTVFFRSESIEKTEPVRALEVYRSAKKLNPNLSLYDEQSKLELLNYAVELPPRDKGSFYQRYNIEKDNGFYHVWELAELASVKSEVFGEPDPELIFWLIVHGGTVPAEKGAAIEDFYRHWKNGKVVQFNICDYVTSGFGMGYCSRRAAKVAEQERAEALSSFIVSIPKGKHELVNSAYKETELFITLKAQLEEMHGGSGRSAWISESIQAQKDDYLAFLKKVVDGYSASVNTEFAETDKQLNETYKQVMAMLKQASSHPDIPDTEELRKVQRQWIKYRDANNKLLSSLSKNETGWSNWLTRERIEQLNDLAKKLENY